MSINYYRSSIDRINKEIAQLEKERATLSQNEANKTADINRLNRSLRSNSSQSTINSLKAQIARSNEEIAHIQSRRAGVEHKISMKRIDLNRLQEQLFREEEKENRKRNLESQKREQEQLRRERSQALKEKALFEELASLKNASKINPNFLQLPMLSDQVVKRYDFFISHASEDKEEFVRPLAKELERSGATVWYDEFELKIGDRLRRSIDKGLLNSRYGVVVLSSSFFKKNWPQYELDGLFVRQMNGEPDAKVVLPIWHKVTKNDVMSFSPSLADIVAFRTTDQTVEEIAQQLFQLVKPLDQDVVDQEIEP